MFVGEFLERGAGKKAQLRRAHRHHRRRTRQSVDKRQFADDGAGAEKSEDALGAGPRHHRDLEQAILDAIAAVAGVAGEEQDLFGFKPDRCRVAEQASRKMLGQSRQQAWIVARQSHGTYRGLLRPRSHPFSLPQSMRQICAKEKPARTFSPERARLNPWQGSWGVWGTCITPWTSRGSLGLGTGGGPLTSNRIAITAWRTCLLVSKINLAARAKREVTGVTERRFSVSF